jgi:hypothetical protein
MLQIADTKLPHTVLCYVAFRAAFHDTLEQIAVHDRAAVDYGGGDPHARFGFLTEVPFLRCVPAHVQLDLLAETWSRHAAHDSHEADLVDEAVLYAACETAGRLCAEEPATVVRYLCGGPIDVTLSVDGLLADELRALHLNLAGEGDFLTISQFEDHPPQEGRELKRKLGVDPDRLDSLFDVLGRWNLSEEFLGNLSGLMTGYEILAAVDVLGVK